MYSCILNAYDVVRFTIDPLLSDGFETVNNFCPY